MENNITSLGNH